MSTFLELCRKNKKPVLVLKSLVSAVLPQKVKVALAFISVVATFFSSCAPNFSGSVSLGATPVPSKLGSVSTDVLPPLEDFTDEK